VAVVDSSCAGSDAGELLDGRTRGIPVVRSLDRAIKAAREMDRPPTHFVLAMTPESGKLPYRAWEQTKTAIEAGLHVVCGVAEFLSDDEEIRSLAARHGVRVTDIHKPPPREIQRTFTGKIGEVTAVKVAVLGTDIGVGTLTTARLLVDALVESGYRTSLVATSQSAWLQGVHDGIVLRSLGPEAAAGEIEHAVWRAWTESSPDIIVIEGIAALFHPAEPGGLDILATLSPDTIVLQHAPGRTHYAGLPDFPIRDLNEQIEAIEVTSRKSVVAIAISRDGVEDEQLPVVCRKLIVETGLPVTDVVAEGPVELACVVEWVLPDRPGRPVGRTPAA
jgi:uncharacterized NAD-dependent epimerase/dehydratase family protein